MLSGRRGRSPPDAEVERSTDSRGTFMMLRRRSVNSCRPFFEWSPSAQLLSRPAQQSGSLFESPEENRKNCLSRPGLLLTEARFANSVPGDGKSRSQIGGPRLVNRR